MNHTRWPALLALAAIAVVAGPLSAGDLYPEKDPVKLPAAVLPAAALVKTLAVNPDKVSLKGIDDAQQLILTATLGTGRLFDLTHDAKYEVADDKIAPRHQHRPHHSHRQRRDHRHRDLRRQVGQGAR